MQQGDHVRIGTGAVSVFTNASVDEDAHGTTFGSYRCARFRVRCLEVSPGNRMGVAPVLKLSFPEGRGR